MYAKPLGAEIGALSLQKIYHLATKHGVTKIFYIAL